MNVRREMAAEELEGAIKVLSHWVERLKSPNRMAVDGLGNSTDYVEFIPEGTSVGRALEANGEYLMLKGELIAVAAKLEGLAST